MFGPHDVDRLSDNSNAQLPVFNSWWHCPGTCAVDAFAVPWSGANNWLHPPLSLIAKVIAKLRDECAVGTLIAPRQPWLPWWPLIQRGPGASSPATSIADLPRRGGIFVANEAAASYGHDGVPMPFGMVAIRLDFRV
mmetsp:Transcript_24480/g.82440  ORF Transcript_24480/g.82440 Transcript_24480/m.82440 type:complete len:137 (+) Transcript_24480:1049-1459(+)